MILPQIETPRGIANVESWDCSNIEFSGIGFLTADGIALNLGFDKNSPHRAAAGLLYMLEQQELNGHTCYPLLDFLDKTASELLIRKNIVVP